MKVLMLDMDGKGFSQEGTIGQWFHFPLAGYAEYELISSLQAVA